MASATTREREGMRMIKAPAVTIDLPDCAGEPREGGIAAVDHERPGLTLPHTDDAWRVEVA